MHSVVQVLLLVGPVMADWQELNFSTTFELPRRVVDGGFADSGEPEPSLKKSEAARADGLLWDQGCR